MKTVLAGFLLAPIISGLFAQDFSNIQVEVAAQGFSFTEGPVWSRDGYLLFSDIPADKIRKLVPGQPVTTFRDRTSGGNGNTYDAQGRIYTCEGIARRVTRQDENGRIAVLVERFEGKRLNSPNDIVVRHDGHIYFTDPAFGPTESTRELAFWGVYHLTPKGEIESVARPSGRPNGIALSPDGQILYVDNSDERNIRAYDLDRDGKASHERVLVADIAGTPDGMKVDVHGNLYVSAKKLFVYSPDGKQLAAISLPETPANCAFGDSDFRTLYVTAQKSVYRIRLGVKGSVQY